MAKHKICRVPGDGIGHDVMEAATTVVEALGLDMEWLDADAGWCMWEKVQNTVPDETWKALESTDCCLFGAITSKPGIKGFKSAILQIRQKFDMYINLRPMRAYEGNPLNFRNRTSSRRCIPASRASATRRFGPRSEFSPGPAAAASSRRLSNTRRSTAARK
jgi:isocitrate/isopropylmalate dehydrogenase